MRQNKAGNAQRNPDPFLFKEKIHDQRRKDERDVLAERSADIKIDKPVRRKSVKKRADYPRFHPECFAHPEVHRDDARNIRKSEYELGAVNKGKTQEMKCACGILRQRVQKHENRVPVSPVEVRRPAGNNNPLSESCVKVRDPRHVILPVVRQR